MARVGDFFRSWREQPARPGMPMRPGQMLPNFDPVHPGASYLMPSIPPGVADQLFARMEAEAQGRGHAGAPGVASSSPYGLTGTLAGSSALAMTAGGPPSSAPPGDPTGGVPSGFQSRQQEEDFAAATAFILGEFGSSGARIGQTVSYTHLTLPTIE